VPRLKDGVVCKVRLNELEGEWLEEKHIEAGEEWDTEYGWDAQFSRSKGMESSLDAPKAQRSAVMGEMSSRGEEASDGEDGRLDRKTVKKLIKELREQCEDRFDASNGDHMMALESLWEGVYPSQSFPKNLKSVHWMTIGFAEEDPRMELRSTHCSVLGLNSLGYFTSQYSADAQQLVISQTGERGYSFVGLGFAVNEMLVKVFDLDGSGDAASSQDFAILLEEPNFYEELFSICCLIADQRKAKSKSGNPRDIESTVRGELYPELQKILSKGPSSSVDIRKQLLNGSGIGWKQASEYGSAASAAAAEQANKAAAEASKLAGKAYAKLGSLFG